MNTLALCQSRYLPDGQLSIIGRSRLSEVATFSNIASSGDGVDDFGQGSGNVDLQR